MAPCFGRTSAVECVWPSRRPGALVFRKAVSLTLQSELERRVGLLSVALPAFI